MVWGEAPYTKWPLPSHRGAHCIPGLRSVPTSPRTAPSGHRVCSDVLSTLHDPRPYPELLQVGLGKATRPLEARALLTSACLLLTCHPPKDPVSSPHTAGGSFLMLAHTPPRKILGWSHEVPASTCAAPGGHVRLGLQLRQRSVDSRLRTVSVQRTSWAWHPLLRDVPGPRPCHGAGWAGSSGACIGHSRPHSSLHSIPRAEGSEFL